jgi:branched-chain amino acid transport system ATP-binding protein
VLDGVDLAVFPGEAVALMGRNGMGKTTTIKTLLGLARPRRGEVRIKGRATTGQPAHRAAQDGIALAPEGRHVFPNLTVRENLLMPARAPARAGAGRAWDLDRVLDLFPALAPRLGRWGRQISGGEQQMVAIGRALMTNPELLILDEATEGLAPLIRAHIWSVLARLKASGVALLVVDKDVRRLLELCDRCVILAKGRVAYSGTAEDLARHPDVHVRLLGV